MTDDEICQIVARTQQMSDSLVAEWLGTAQHPEVGFCVSSDVVLQLLSRVAPPTQRDFGESLIAAVRIVLGDDDDDTLASREGWWHPPH